VSTDPGETTEALARRLYPALAAGNRDALLELLDSDFRAHFADGMPFGIGGEHAGAPAAIAEGWWEIGRAYSVRAEPREWIRAADGRLLVVGRYHGRARATGRNFEAEFMHLWESAGGRLVTLRQLTDTAAWTQALAPELF
jgi:ketosteroid isomerase-like protein